MLIKTQPNMDNPLIVYKSLYTTPPHWQFYDSSDDSAQSSVWVVEAGRIILSILNQINPLKYNGDDEASLLTDDILFDNTNTLSYDHNFHKDIGYIEKGKEEEYKLEHEKNHDDNSVDNDEYSGFNRGKFEYLKHYNILVNVIAERESTDPKTLFNIYNIYKNFALCYLNDQPFEEKPINDTSPSGKSPIKMIGNRIGSNGIQYEAFKLNGYGEFFALDLWELLFNPNISIIIKQCKNCGDFFRVTSKKFVYCSECRKIKDKINNKRYRQDPVYRLKKSIIEKIDRNKAFKDKPYLKEEFYCECQYYQDIIENGYSQIKCLPTYRNDIKTKEDLINWLEEYEDKIRIYKKKISKFDEEV